MAVGLHIKSGLREDPSQWLARMWEFTQIMKPTHATLVCSMSIKIAEFSEDYARKLSTEEEHPDGFTASQTVDDFCGNIIDLVWHLMSMGLLC